MYYIRALIYDFLSGFLYVLVLEALRSVLETLGKYTHVQGVVPLAQEDLWKLSSDKREVFFLFIAIYCLISTQTYCNQRVKIAGL